jgi:hypothetical protein
MSVYHLTNSLKYDHHPRKWQNVIWNLFSDHENPYYKACSDENIDLVRKLIKKGHTADTTYLWNSPQYQCCKLEGCYVMNTRHPPPIFVLLIQKPDRLLTRKLFDYGLLSVDDIPAELLKELKFK